MPPSTYATYSYIYLFIFKYLNTFGPLYNVNTFEFFMKFCGGFYGDLSLDVVWQGLGPNKDLSNEKADFC